MTKAQNEIEKTRDIKNLPTLRQPDDKGVERNGILGLFAIWAQASRLGPSKFLAPPLSLLALGGTPNPEGPNCETLSYPFHPLIQVYSIDFI
jgi:hypothetical protein